MSLPCHRGIFRVQRQETGPVARREVRGQPATGKFADLAARGGTRDLNDGPAPVGRVGFDQHQCLDRPVDDRGDLDPDHTAADGLAPRDDLCAVAEDDVVPRV